MQRVWVGLERNRMKVWGGKTTNFSKEIASYSETPFAQFHFNIDFHDELNPPSILSTAKENCRDWLIENIVFAGEPATSWAQKIRFPKTATTKILGLQSRSRKKLPTPDSKKSPHLPSPILSTVFHARIAESVENDLTPTLFLPLYTLYICIYK